MLFKNIVLCLGNNNQAILDKWKFIMHDDCRILMGQRKNGRSDSTSSILTLHGGHDSVLWGAHKLSEEHIGATGHPHYYLNTKVRTLGKLKYGRFFFAGMLIFDRKLKNR